MRNEAASRACRERQTQLQHTLPLGSYLLKPVQRILKYHLLLQNIVKHCDRNTSGYSDIIVALSAMTGIAHHINDMKRKHEHAVRVQEVQSLLDGWPVMNKFITKVRSTFQCPNVLIQGEDLTTYGELVAEGAFRMYGAKAPRHVFLLDKMLLICKRKEDGTLGYKAHIMVKLTFLFFLGVAPESHDFFMPTVFQSDANRKCSWRTVELPRHPIQQSAQSVHSGGEFH